MVYERGDTMRGRSQTGNVVKQTQLLVLILMLFYNTRTDTFYTDTLSLTQRGDFAGLHMATEASDSLGRLRSTCSSCPESDTS